MWEGNGKTHILHDTNCLLGLRDKIIFGLLDLLLRLVAKLMVFHNIGTGRGATHLPGGALDAGLDGVECQTGLLDVLAGTRSKRDVGIKRGVPPGKEAALDLGILGKASFTNTLLDQSVLLEGSRQGVLASTGMLLMQRLAASQARAGDSMGKSLGLRLRGRGRSESSLGFGGGGGSRKEVDLLTNGTTKIGERLLDVGRIVVGLVGVLGAVKILPRQPLR